MMALEKFAETGSITARRADSPLGVEEALIADLLSAIQRAVRTTLRVGLRADDGSQRNQDALALVHDAWAKLQHRLDSGNPVQNPTAYAFLTARNLCLDYLRRQSPQQRSLRDSVLRILRVTPGFAAWRTNGRWLTGFDQWQATAKPPVSSETIRALLASSTPWCSADSCTVDSQPSTRAAWRRLFVGIFISVGATLRLDDVIAVIRTVTNEPEFRGIELDELESHEPSPAVRVRSREELGLTFTEIASLPRAQRVALLLNSIDAELDQFAFSGVASLQEFAAILEVTLKEFAILSRVVPAFGAEIATAPMSLVEQFAALWRHVPLDGRAIAAMLGLTPREVMNRRSAARQRLHRRLARGFSTRRRPHLCNGGRRDARSGAANGLVPKRIDDYTL